MESRLTKANGQWKKLMKMYEDLKDTKRYISFSEPFVEMGADGIKRIKAKCLGCSVKYSAESNNLLTNHQHCAQSQQKYNLYVASRIQEESNKPDEVDAAELRRENSELKQEVITLKENYERKIAILENQLKEASLLIKEE